MTTGWQPSEAYPDPAIVTLDPRFDAIKPPMNAGVERLFTGCRWSEGPVWFGDMRCVLWSDIPNNRILRWDEETGKSASSASRRTTPTATRATGREGSSPASMAEGRSRAPSMTARSR